MTMYIQKIIINCVVFPYKVIGINWCPQLNGPLMANEVYYNYYITSFIQLG